MGKKDLVLALLSKFTTTFGLHFGAQGSLVVLQKTQWEPPPKQKKQCNLPSIFMKATPKNTGANSVEYKSKDNGGDSHGATCSSFVAMI